MKRFAISFVLVSGILAVGGCNRKQADNAAQTSAAAAQSPGSAPATPVAGAETTPDAASPNDMPATVTLTDGGHYKGVLVSKSGSELTFRGDNGATRTFDSRDIRSIRFGDTDTSAAKNDQPASRPKRASSAGDSAAPVSSPTPAAAPVRRQITIPAGTQLSVRANEDIDSKTAASGQTFDAQIASNVVDANGNVAIPSGSSAKLVVRQAGAGKIHANDLALDLSSVTVRGTPYEVETATLYEKGKDGLGANKRTAKFAGGGAALGAIVGAIAGGGKGAAIGAAAGSGAGAGTQVFTRGSVKVPAESLLTFKLENPLTLDAR